MSNIVKRHLDRTYVTYEVEPEVLDTIANTFNVYTSESHDDVIMDSIILDDKHTLDALVELLGIDSNDKVVRQLPSANYIVFFA